MCSFRMCMRVYIHLYTRIPTCLHTYMRTYIHTHTPVRGAEELPLPPPAPVKQAPLQTQAGQIRARINASLGPSAAMMSGEQVHSDPDLEEGEGPGNRKRARFSFFLFVESCHRFCCLPRPPAQRVLSFLRFSFCFVSCSSGSRCKVLRSNLQAGNSPEAPGNDPQPFLRHRSLGTAAPGATEARALGAATWRWRPAHNLVLSATVGRGFVEFQVDRISWGWKSNGEMQATGVGRSGVQRMNLARASTERLEGFGRLHECCSGP